MSKPLGPCPPRFRQLRRKHIKTVSKNPKAKPRHEIVNTNLYITQEQSNYVDIYEAGPLRNLPFSSSFFGFRPCLSPQACLVQGCFASLTQEGDWMSLDKYCKTKLDSPVRKKLKTQAQKKKYVTKASGLKPEPFNLRL